MTIDFLTRAVDPFALARRREAYIAVCAHFLKQSEGRYNNRLLRAQITLRQDAEQQTHYDVVLETKDPPLFGPRSPIAIAWFGLEKFVPHWVDHLSSVAFASARWPASHLPAPR